MEKEALVSELCEREWVMFDKVNNAGGRASCQQDPAFFRKMRACQFENWNLPLLESYRRDLMRAAEEGRNLLTEKYAWMMSWTHPEEFARIRDALPSLSPEKRDLVSAIVSQQSAWEDEVDKRYPYMRSGGRQLTQDREKGRSASFQTYLAGELMTYSADTLKLYLDWMHELQARGENMALLTARSIAKAYGYASLEDADMAMKKRLERP
ncbi:MAG: DUF4125 family protein [Mailhella sp.]|jgi:hypothetical protein|nr:DUF4125 family protein [Mailhella sp.]